MEVAGRVVSGDGGWQGAGGVLLMAMSTSRLDG